MPSFIENLLKKIPSGLVAFQLREKGLDGGELFEIALKMRKITKKYKSMLFINDRVDVAIAVGADGVHLPQSGLPPKKVRKIFNGFIAVSTHNLNESLNAKKNGADFLLLSPIFETISKPMDKRKAMGIEKLKEICKKVKIPVFPLGGINKENAHLLEGTKIGGVACIGSILKAKNPVDELMEIIKRAKI